MSISIFFFSLMLRLNDGLFWFLPFDTKPVDVSVYAIHLVFICV